MSYKLKTILVDDEPFALKGLKKYIDEIGFIELIATYENALEANEGLKKHSVDLMFLDIEMPKISGIQFLKTLDRKPITIITTASPEYAIEGYELSVIDYLIKPFSFERFLKAANKAKEYFELTKTPTNSDLSQQDFCFVKCDKKIEKIFFEDILYIEGLNNYVIIHTTDKKFTTYLTLKNVEDYLPGDKFLKIQKSFIVSISKITGIEEDAVVINTKSISISRTNKTEILKTILGNNFLKR